MNMYCTCSFFTPHIYILSFSCVTSYSCVDGMWRTSSFTLIVIIRIKITLSSRNPAIDTCVGCGSVIICLKMLLVSKISLQSQYEYRNIIYRIPRLRLYVP